MATIWALLPAQDAAAVFTAVQAVADRDRVTRCRPGTGCRLDQSVGATGADCCPCGRTADQRRADALTSIAHSVLADPDLPHPHGARPSVQVTVALSTLLGLDDLPADLAHHGPVPAAVARRIAADPTGTWRRLLTDPATGTLLDHGRTRYTPPADLADHVITRDRECVFPTCTRPARHCHLDHRDPYPHGPTTAGNLNALCERHHRLKHRRDWQLQRTDHHAGPPRYHWTTPTRHHYDHHTPPVGMPEQDTPG